MARSDPHGWTLTIISVCVVFFALIILYGAYVLIGWLNTGGLARACRRPEKAEAAGILEDGALKAAIATALHLYMEEEAHDTESGTITFSPAPRTWADPRNNFRKQVPK